MPTRIKHLRCRVTVKTGKKQELQHGAAKPVRPELTFAMPQAEPRSEGSPEPSQTATEQRGQNATPLPQAAPAGADPHAVADRVYELMQQEVRQARTRGV